MLEGTKKLFPKEYKQFTEAMIEAAKDDALPVTLKLEDIKNFTLKNIEDVFYDFTRDTGLDIHGELYTCEDCGKLHLFLEINYPEEKHTMLQ